MQYYYNLQSKIIVIYFISHTLRVLLFFFFFLPDSTITGLNTNTMIILGLDSKDSKNYTCIVSTIDANEKTVETSYKHQIIGIKFINTLY